MEESILQNIQGAQSTRTFQFRKASCLLCLFVIFFIYLFIYLSIYLFIVTFVIIIFVYYYH